MEILFSFLLIIYLSLLMVCRTTWKSLDGHFQAKETSSLPGVTVVIPMRNEETHLNCLMKSLEALDYPREKLEIIAVDDASEDDTPKLLSLAESKTGLNFRWFSLNDEVGFQTSYKKRALTEAIMQARFPVIVTTDADCQFHPQWLNTIVGYMIKEQAIFTSGPVVYIGKGVARRLLDLELASLMAIGAASLIRGFPNMCNGANLAFTREAFLAVDGYQGFTHIASGDDEFLLYKMQKKFPGQLAFIKNEYAIVKTAPPVSWRSLINQRKRWSGKWKFHRSWNTKGLAIFIFTFHALFLAVITLTALGIYSWKMLLAQVSLKILIEYLFLAPVMRFLGNTIDGLWFLMMQLIYSIYAVFFGVVSNIGSFHWKNRKYP